VEVVGFYREAAIDLSPGFQPWVSRTKRYALKALPTPRGGCNSQLAQYSNAPILHHSDVAGFEDEDDDENEAPHEWRPRVVLLAIREPLSHTVPRLELLLSPLLPPDSSVVRSSPANATSDGLLQPQSQPRPRMQPHWLLTASRIR
jgi:hypothetical protein